VYVSHVFETMYFNHSFIIKFQELAGKLFFVSPEQLVKTGLDIRVEWFLSWSQISKMAGSRSNDIGPNRNYPKFQVIWTTFDPAPKGLKFEIFSAKNQFACK
jgi:hypothetical protein